MRQVHEPYEKDERLSIANRLESEAKMLRLEVERDRLAKSAGYASEEYQRAARELQALRKQHSTRYSSGERDSLAESVGKGIPPSQRAAQELRETYSRIRKILLWGK